MESYYEAAAVYSLVGYIAGYLTCKISDVFKGRKHTHVKRR